jgi:hypothetical protein
MNRYKHTTTGEIKTHQQWQNELGMSFHNERLPEFLIVPQHTVPEPTLEQRRERQRQMLKMERIDRVSAPINNVQVATPEDRENVEWAASNVESVDWIMADNTVQTLTAADLQAVISQYPLRKMELFSAYAGLLAQLAESDEPELIVWPDN